MLPPRIAKTFNDYKTDVFLVPYIIVSQASTVCGIDIYLIVSNIAQEKLYVGLFGFCEPFWILFGKWQLSNGNLNLRVQISLLLPQTHRFRDISLSNFIMHVHGISPRARQAGDNMGFYCTVLEAPRGGVLCPILEFNTRRVQISLLFSLKRTVFKILQFLIRPIC